MTICLCFFCLFLFSPLSKVTVGYLFTSTQHNIVTLIHTIFWITYFLTDLHASLLKAKSETHLLLQFLQMRKMLKFRENGVDSEECPCQEEIRENLRNFHNNLLDHCKMPELNAEPVQEPVIPPRPTMRQRLMALVWKTSEEENNSTEVKEAPPGLFSISLYVALQDSLCVWCALALACVASEVCCHKYFFVLTLYIFLRLTTM